MNKPKIIRFDFGCVSDTQITRKDDNKEIHDDIKIDEIILWDAYWEQQLLKNGTYQNTFTKIRVLPYQKKVNLILEFYFKHDNDKYNKEKAKFNLKIEIPNTIYGKKEFTTITGKDLLNRKIFYKTHKDGKTIYCCKIASFTSDIVDADFPQPLKEKQN